jgi:hypothetical protein
VVVDYRGSCYAIHWDFELSFSELSIPEFGIMQMMRGIRATFAPELEQLQSSPCLTP